MREESLRLAGIRCVQDWVPLACGPQLSWLSQCPSGGPLLGASSQPLWWLVPDSSALQEDLWLDQGRRAPRSADVSCGAGREMQDGKWSLPVCSSSPGVALPSPSSYCFLGFSLLASWLFPWLIAVFHGEDQGEKVYATFSKTEVVYCFTTTYLLLHWFLLFIVYLLLLTLCLIDFSSNL